MRHCSSKWVLWIAQLELEAGTSSFLRLWLKLELANRGLSDKQICEWPGSHPVNPKKSLGLARLGLCSHHRSVSTLMDKFPSS
jgi:hypothetical protein